MINEKFIKIASQFCETPSDDVIKIASLAEKIKSLWKSITDPKYRELVSQLTEDSLQTNLYSKELNQKLKSLASAIKTGDVNSYLIALKDVKEVVNNLLIELKSLEAKTNSAFKYTLNHLPVGYDIEVGKEYESAPLRSFEWFKERKYDLFVGSNPEESKATQSLINKILDKLSPSYEDRESFKNEYFTGNKLKDFITSFIQAVFGGYLKKVFVSKKIPNRRELIVETLPFEIPGLSDVVIKTTVQLIDEIKSIKSPARMSLKKVLSVNLVNKREDLTERKSIIVDKFLKIAEEVPFKFTTLSDLDLAQVLKEGYFRVFGKDPTLETLGIAWAQVALESGRPVKLPNNNIGNIKASDAWISSGGLYFIKDTKEFSESGKPFIHEKAKWRAYKSPVEGAMGYWNLINNRYKPTLAWMSTGDPTSTAITLGLQGYYTANISGYSSGVASLYREFMEKLAYKFMNLQSAPAEPPGAVPQVKNWAKEYSQEERDAILENNYKKDLPDNYNNEVTNQDNDIDDLLSKLLTSNSVTKIIKRSILNKIPDNLILITVNSKQSISSKVYYAHVFSSILRKFFNIESDICKFNDNVEISCRTKMGFQNLAGAVQEVSDLIANKMLDKTGNRIYPLVISGFNSEYERINVDELLRHLRKFNLKRVSYE